MSTETKPAQTKMHAAIKIMRALIAEHPNMEKRQINRLFKDRVKTELNMTVNGANTYCTNVRTFLSGGDPYATNKNANAKRKQLADAAREIPELHEIATKIGLLKHPAEINTEHRWWVINEAELQIVETHATRSTAQKVAAAFGIVWKDKTEIVIA